MAYKYFAVNGGALRRRLLSQWLDSVIPEGMKDEGIVAAAREKGMKLARGTISRARNQRGDASDQTVEFIAVALGIPYPPEIRRAGRVAEEQAGYLGIGDPQLEDEDLLQLFVHRPDEVTRRLERWKAAGMKPQFILAWLEDAEIILQEKHGRKFARLIAQLRADVLGAGDGA